MEDKSLYEASNKEINNIILNEPKEYLAFEKSWEKLEKEYPIIAQKVLKDHYDNDLEKLHEDWDENGDDKTRQKIIEYVKEYLSSNNANPIQKQKEQIFEFCQYEQDNNCYNKEAITRHIKEAFDTADTYIKTIQKKNGGYANWLKNQVKEINDTYLPLDDKKDYYSQYVKIVEALANIFKNINGHAYIDDENLKIENWIIKKETIDNTMPVNEKRITCTQLIHSARSVATMFAQKVIDQYNHKLATDIQNTAIDLAGTAMKMIESNLVTFEEAYDYMINNINRLIIESCNKIQGNNANNPIEVEDETNKIPKDILEKQEDAYEIVKTATDNLKEIEEKASIFTNASNYEKISNLITARLKQVIMINQGKDMSEQVEKLRSEIETTCSVYYTKTLYLIRTYNLALKGTLAWNTGQIDLNYP